MADNTPNIPIVICKCGSVIPTDNIDHRNGSNEEGEEYGEVSAQCTACKTQYETFQWGNWENEQEAMKCLQEYITENA